MLKFHVFENGTPARQFPVRNAYLLGSDGNAVRANITFENGVITCDKRESGVASLSLQQKAGDSGELTLQTCLLPDREEPYLLSLELARHRVMTLYHKSEDWGMFDIRIDHPISKRIESARKTFIQALCLQAEDPVACDKQARECLGIAIEASEELAIAHADLLLNRRRQTGALPRFIIGCGVAPEQDAPMLRAGVRAHFDFLNLPTPWKQLAPEEGEYRFDQMAAWVDWAHKNGMPVIAGPLVSFQPHALPDWLFIWEHDYETVRDLVYEHVERVVNRFKDKIQIWNVVSGLHVNNHFTMAFDQLVDLTRMAAMVVKKTQPNSRIMVELREPFGEYYGGNQRSIPPMMYADLLIQGQVQFDAFSIKFLMGQSQPGQFTRDLMQISDLLDHFSPLGKPLNIVVAAPSAMVTEEMIVAPDNGAAVDPNSGFWRKPWSPHVQGHWFEAILHIALSKPFVESVSWHQVMDHPNIEMPLGGLITEELQPKQSLRRLASFRRAISASTQFQGQLRGPDETE